MYNVCAHNLDGLLVGSALRDDEVGIAFGGLDEFFVHRLKDIKIAVENHLCGSASLYCVALYDADEPFVGVGIDEYLQVHEVAQLLLPQRHNALDDDDLAGLHMYGFWQTVADEVAVCGLLDAFSLTQSLYLLGEKLPVEGVGMVKINTFALLGSKMSGVVVVGVLRDECYPVDGQRLQNFLCNGCLAGTRSAGDAYDIHGL